MFDLLARKFFGFGFIAIGFSLVLLGWFTAALVVSPGGLGFFKFAAFTVAIVFLFWIGGRLIAVACEKEED